MLGAVIVLGDFNVHLGQLGGVRGVGETNVQGVLLNDMLSRCHLNTVSLGSVVSGPCYTYISGDKRTTVDYILADEEATSMVSCCQTCLMEDLNTSDHLPLVAEVMHAAVPADAPHPCQLALTGNCLFHPVRLMHIRKQSQSTLVA